MTTTPNEKPGLGYRLLTIIRMTLISLILIAVLTALAWGGFLLFEEVNRSLDSINLRVDTNKQRIGLVQEDVATLKAGNPEQIQQIADLATAVATLDDELTAVRQLTGQLTADLADQETVLAALQTDLATVQTTAASTAGDAATLTTALTAMQEDINRNNSQLDDLGGSVDGLRSNIDQMGDNVANLEPLGGLAMAADNRVAEMEETLALFQVWQLISRARLHLVENNVGLATNDVQTALRATQSLAAAETAVPTTTLNIITTRLALALGNLPDNVTAADQDLTIIWDQLDALITARVFPDLVEEIEAGTTEGTATEAEAETTEEVPAEATEATEAPTAAPTPTPSP